MNSFLATIVMAVYEWDFNISNLTAHGIFRAAFDPYVAIFGSYFFGIFFGVIGVAIFAEEKSLAHIFGYLVIVGLFIGAVLPSLIGSIFGLLTGIVFAVIFYRVYVERVRNR